MRCFNGLDRALDALCTPRRKTQVNNGKCHDSDVKNGYCRTLIQGPFRVGNICINPHSKMFPHDLFCLYRVSTEPAHNILGILVLDRSFGTTMGITPSNQDGKQRSHSQYTCICSQCRLLKQDVKKESHTYQSTRSKLPARRQSGRLPAPYYETKYATLPGQCGRKMEV
jgi:hypothetical protein